MTPDQVLNPWRWTGKPLDAPLRLRKPRFIEVPDLSVYPVEARDRTLAAIALCPRHTFYVPMEKPGRMAEYLTDPETPSRVAWTIAEYEGHNAQWVENCVNNRSGRTPWPPKNLILGIRASTQGDLDRDVPHLLQCPAVLRAIDLDPLVEEVDLRLRPMKLPRDTRPVWERIAAMADEPRIEWLRVGGDVGKRPCNIKWIRGVVRQCEAAGVPCWVTRLGSRPWCGCASGKPTKTVGTWICRECGADWMINVFHRTGSDPSEWPEDVRKRQVPEVGR